MHNSAQSLDEYTKPLNGLRLSSPDPNPVIEGIVGELAGITSTLTTVELFGRYSKGGEEWLRFQVACSYFYLFLIEVSLDAVDFTLSPSSLHMLREKTALRIYVRQYGNQEKSDNMLEYFLAFYSSNLNVWYDLASTAPDSQRLISTFCEWITDSCNTTVNQERLENNLKTMWDKKLVPLLTSLIINQN